MAPPCVPGPAMPTRAWRTDTEDRPAAIRNGARGCGGHRGGPGCLHLPFHLLTPSGTLVAPSGFKTSNARPAGSCVVAHSRCPDS
jgi:hypothetical protein